ncbi:MAG: hypothetical protein Q9160_000998 [Pyrenula sp. 1 TL-2023]
MPPRINIPPITRVLLLTLLASSFLYNLARWRQISTMPQGQIAKVSVPYLALVPASSLLNPWTFLTTTFVEQNIFNLLINAAALFFGGKYLERAWGSKEFGKVILVASFVPNLTATLAYILWGAMFGTGETAQVTLSGGIAIQAAFLVAFKQLVPEHTVTILKGLVKMRVKHFVSLFLLANTVSGFVLGTDTAALLAWLGVLTSWTYLRFYKRQPDLSSTSTTPSTLRGDASSTFTFASFFPDVLQPPITLLTTQIYNILIALKILTPFSNEDIASGNEQAAARGEAGLPSLLNNAGRGRSMAKREEAERRRALALKALDQRLSVASMGRGQNPTPSQQPQPQQQPAPQSTAQAQAQAQSQASAALGGTDYTPEEGGSGGR